MSIAAPRRYLEALFQAAVKAADPMVRLPRFLPPRPKGRLIVIGAGKASARMAETLEKHYGPCEGLVITRYGYERPTKGIEIASAAHPVPDQAAIDATRRLLDLVSDLTPDDLVIALISGGGSALLCAPSDGVTLADKMNLTSQLLACGATISEINTVRQTLSLVKGGQLATACAPARVLSLLISDVPGDDPALIASGPTVPSTTTAKQALALIEKWGLDVPAHVLDAMHRYNSVTMSLEHCETHIIAAPSQSLAAAADSAGDVDVHILGDAIEGEARDVARAHADLALQMQRRGLQRPAVILSGGECTVTRTGTGIGGPNAEYVLAAALALDGATGIHVLAADTDGVDGADEIAGAYAGPKTLTAARALGIDALAALKNNDAHSFFKSLGTQVITGPTLTNVNDFRAILIHKV
jgi:hydroxypyruvate reductase